MQNIFETRHLLEKILACWVDHKTVRLTCKLWNEISASHLKARPDHFNVLSSDFVTKWSRIHIYDQFVNDPKLENLRKYANPDNLSLLASVGYSIYWGIRQYLDYFEYSDDLQITPARVNRTHFVKFTLPAVFSCPGYARIEEKVKGSEKK